MTDQESLTDMVRANAERFGGAVGVRRRRGGSWVDVTTREFAGQVHDLARGLIAAGLRAGDRVALLAGSRYEWTLFDFAVWSAGCQTVPVDPAASPEEIEWILSDSGACAVVLEHSGHRETLRRMVDRLPEIGWVWQLDADGADDTDEVVPAVAELTELGAEVDDHTAHARRLAVGADAVATLVYPAGVDRPKRVELTHGELLAEVRATIAASAPMLRSGSSLLVLLPPADLAARILSIACVYTRTTLGHVPDTEHLSTDLGIFRPRVIVAGTDLLRALHASAKEKAAAEGRTRVFGAAESVAVAYGTGRRSFALRLGHAVADAVVYPKLRARFGGRCVAAITSGTPLEPELERFYRGIGIRVHALPAVSLIESPA
ncbi:AMP-binding protein [Actinophytocola gossypii]|uniref:AMP-binding protein n=1 Tax=Actinophytocola gossypii TaxID=2812003 RepID=A0ABT2J8A6_9PSEU|nr:AMP-binding protein [Actinophytocola gossypii]MCT2584091.1 AMP-binding protein [Actinophytocola gossypii]